MQVTWVVRLKLSDHVDLKNDGVRTATDKDDIQAYICPC